MRLTLSFIAAFCISSFVGCGSKTEPTTVDNSDIQSYLEANPEMADGDSGDEDEGDSFDAGE